MNNSSQLIPNAEAGRPAHMENLDYLLQQTATRHSHLCPRQVLGVRMGLMAGEVLKLSLPQTTKRLITIMETNGCASDGVSVATNCWVGRRTMWIEDYGKVAATFVDTQTGQALRIWPRQDIRLRATDYAPNCASKWETQLLGYQQMPNHILLNVQPVQLNTAVKWLVSKAGHRTICDRCGEEILNEREIVRGQQNLCKSCAGQGYYQPVETAILQEPTLPCPSPI